MPSLRPDHVHECDPGARVSTAEVDAALRVRVRRFPTHAHSRPRSLSQRSARPTTILSTYRSRRSRLRLVCRSPYLGALLNHIIQPSPADAPRVFADLQARSPYQADRPDSAPWRSLAPGTYTCISSPSPQIPDQRLGSAHRLADSVPLGPAAPRFSTCV